MSAWLELKIWRNGKEHLARRLHGHLEGWQAGGPTQQQHLWVVRLPDTQFAAGACTCAAYHTRLTTRSLSVLSPLLKLSIRTTLNRTPTHTPPHLSPLLKLITRCRLWRHAPPKGTWRGGDSAIPFRPSPTRWASRRPWRGSAFVLFSPSIPPSSCMFDVWKVVVPLRRSVRVLVS